MTHHNIMDDIENEIEKNYSGIEDSMRSVESAHRKVLDLEDYKYLLFKAR